MKKILFSFIFCIISLSTFAQKASDKALSESIQKLNAAKTFNDFQEVKNSFNSQITETSNWRVSYYAALSILKQADILVRAKKFSEVDALTDEALIYLNSLAKMEAENSEIRALKAYFYVLKTSVNPLERMSTYGIKASEILYLAQSIDHNNPRFDLLRSELEYLKNGKKLLTQFQNVALKLKSFSAKSKLDPNWGLKDAEYYISILK